MVFSVSAIALMEALDYMEIIVKAARIFCCLDRLVQFCQIAK
jgi:hypothetical protein